MAHSIQEGKVEILKCVSPGCYWVRCRACRKASLIPEGIKYKGYLGSYYPSQGANVLVRCNDNFFYRGIVCGTREFISSISCMTYPRPSLRKYVIHLIDIFQVKDFDRQDIYPSFKEKSNSCAGAHLVSLHNFLPSTPPKAFGSTAISLKARSNEFFKSASLWENQKIAMENMLKSREYYFYYEHVTTINGALYGNILFENLSTREKLSIAEYACAKNSGVINTLMFKKIINLLMHAPLSKDYDAVPMCSLNASILKKRRRGLRCRRMNMEQMTSVYHKDKDRYESLITTFSLNVLLTRPPSNGTKVIGYINPEGNIVMGTVFSPKVHLLETVNDKLTEKNKHRLMLDNYFRQHTYSGQNNNRTIHLESLQRESESEESDDSSSKITKEPELQGLLRYNFCDSLKTFQREGGILDGHCTLEVSNIKFRPLRELIEHFLEILNVQCLKTWQEVCLPSILCKQNIFIVGPKSNKKITTLMICAIASMNLDHPLSCIGPSCIVFVSDWKRADAVAELCRLLSNLKVLVSVTTIITETQINEASHPCNVLITTPDVWLKLINLNDCFGENSISHVIFDKYEQLHENYSSEICKIFENLKNSDKKQIQISVTSDFLCSSIIDQIETGGIVTTHCVIDMVQTAFCKKLSPTVVLISDEWDNEIFNIIQKCNGIYSLLLCSDFRQVSSIQNCIKDLKNVICVHENQDKQTATGIIEKWNTNKNSLLISSDVLFDKMNYTNDVNVLLSWTTCNRETLNNRFMSIRERVLRLQKVQVYLVCNKHNLNSLLFVKDIVKGVDGIKYIGDNMEDCINVSSKMLDKLKIDECICPHLCMFGMCKERLKCIYKHHILPQDVCFNIRDNCYLKVELVTFHSIFHLSVRVLEVLGNQGHENSLSHYCTKLNKIEKELKSVFESEHHNDGTVLTFQRGDIVGVYLVECNEQFMRRAKIIDIFGGGHEQMFDISLIDYNVNNLKVHARNLFRIPIKIQKYPKDIVDIYISGLIPSNFRTDWAFETSYFLNAYTKLLDNTCSTTCQLKLIAGTVQLAMRHEIIVNSVYLYKTHEMIPNGIIVDGCLKKVCIQSGYVVKNQRHLDQFLNLVADHGKSSILSKLDDQFGCRRTVPQDMVEVSVTSYDHPGLFYIQLVDEERELVKFEELLTNCINTCKRQLRIIAKYELCAIKIEDNYNRAVILSLEEEPGKVQVMCVDYGDVRTVSYEELFYLPNKFIDDHPYFAIECELVGILPFDGVWTDEVVSRFTNHIRKDGEQMLKLNMKFFGVAIENRKMKQYRHQVALYGNNTIVNQVLVEEGLASWNDATVGLLLNRPLRGRSRLK